MSTLRATVAGAASSRLSGVHFARLTAPGAKTVSSKQSAPATTAGNEATVSIKLPSAPAAGSAAKLDVQVGAVPGEKNTDNNKASYTIIFTG